MADIQAIRDALDTHLALHADTVGAKVDADKVATASNEAIEKAKSAFNAVSTRAKKTFNTSVETAESKRDAVIAEEEKKVVAANDAVVSSVKAGEDFRAKVLEDLNIPLPDYSGASRHGRVVL